MFRIRTTERMRRRDVLQIGGLGAVGLTLPGLLRRQAAASTASGRAKSCIVLFLMGGPPQHSTWDPKPHAAAEVRGELGAICTSVPAMNLCELMPNLARQAEKLCVLRAVSTGDNAHSSSGYYMLTGKPHQPMNRENANPGRPNDWPCWGAVVQRQMHTRGSLPAAIRLPMHIFNTDGSVWPGQDAGFLGDAADPWLLRCAPGASDYAVREFQLPLDVSPARLHDRTALLESLNLRLRAAEQSRAMDRYEQFTQRALGLLTADRARSAFDLDAEPAQVRERYGPGHFGQSTLLARRLVEAGARLVQVNWYRGPDEPADAPCWDSHARETARLKEVLLPPMDQAFAALLEDLEQRGRLDETLVVCMAEFGRTPRFNARGGRDHWGRVFSVAMAGGGVRGGVVYGASDRLGAEPLEGLVTPEDLAATIFQCLGLPPQSGMRDAQGREFTLSHGTPIAAILV